jgi:hypothetical protein
MPHTPALYALTDSVFLDAEPVSSLLYCHPVLGRVPIVSHAPMLDPSGTTRKPLEAILGALNRVSVSSGGVSWTSQQDTLQGAVVYGSKEVNCRCPAIVDLVAVL